MSGNPGSHAIEQILDNPLATTGVSVYHSTNIMEWQLTGGGALTSSSAPLVKKSPTGMSGMMVIQWEFDDTASTPAIYTGTIPDDFKTASPEWVVTVPTRKVDSGADENADLDLRLDLTWVTSAGAVDSITAIDVLLDASNDGDPVVFQQCEFDLGAALIAAGKTIPVGATFALTLSPDDTVGTTNMTMECLPPTWRWRRYLQPLS